MTDEQQALQWLEDFIYNGGRVFDTNNGIGLQDVSDTLVGHAHTLLSAIDQAQKRGAT